MNFIKKYILKSWGELEERHRKLQGKYNKILTSKKVLYISPIIEWKGIGMIQGNLSILGDNTTMQNMMVISKTKKAMVEVHSDNNTFISSVFSSVPVSKK